MTTIQELHLPVGEAYRSRPISLVDIYMYVSVLLYGKDCIIVIYKSCRILTVLVHCVQWICSNGQEVETQEIICVPLHSKHHWCVFIHSLVPFQLGLRRNYIGNNMKCMSQPLWREHFLILLCYSINW